MNDSPTRLDTFFKIDFLKKRLDQMVGAILKEPDRTVIWVGAGLSAKYGTLPTWTQFLKSVVETVRGTGRCKDQDLALVERLINLGRLSMAAELLAETIGDELRNQLVSQFSQPQGCLPEKLAYLNARDIITTNYDTLLSDLLPWYKEVHPSDGLEHLISDNFKIVKIHGTVKNPMSCVLSTSQYANAYNPNLYWYLANILSNHTVVFLGSSMNAAEPYFKTLQFLKANRRLTRVHYAIKNINSSAEGADEGRRLEQYGKQYGIELIPYIADKTHTFVEEIFDYLDSVRGSPAAVDIRLQGVRRRLEERNLFHAVALLWHASHAPIEHRETKRKLGDTVSEFFEVAGTGHPDEQAALMRLVAGQFDLSQIWARALDLSVRSDKSLFGFERSLTHLEALTKKQQPLLRARLKDAKLERQKEKDAFERKNRELEGAEAQGKPDEHDKNDEE
jgi:hypothetical protein